MITLHLRSFVAVDLRLAHESLCRGDSDRYLTVKAGDEIAKFNFYHRSTLINALLLSVDITRNVCVSVADSNRYIYKARQGDRLSVSELDFPRVFLYREMQFLHYLCDVDVDKRDFRTDVY